MAIERLRGSLGGIATGVLTGATIFANVLAQAILTLIVAFFFINDGRRIWGGLVGLLRPSVRDDAHALGKRTFTILKAYSRGIIVVAVVDSVLIGLALLAVGVPLTLPIVVLTFLGAFFPLIGAVAAGAVAVLVTLVTNGLTDAIIILVAVLIVQQVEGNLLYPYVVGRLARAAPAADPPGPRRWHRGGRRGRRADRRSGDGGGERSAVVPVGEGAAGYGAGGRG
ncbi:MAG: AI-2E family transporter [Thermoleophilaceae bacterium]